MAGATARLPGVDTPATHRVPNDQNPDDLSQIDLSHGFSCNTSLRARVQTFYQKLREV